MDSQLPKRWLIQFFFLLFVLLSFSLPVFAGETDLDIFGLTYHLHRKGAVENAPLKLDHAGVKVFNPGLGLGYDFRPDRHTNGFSAIVHGGMFVNCDNHPFTFAGAGARYRKFFHKDYYFEVNTLAILSYGNSSDHKSYELDPLPYANIGVGKDYGKYSITYYLSYIPKNSGGSITSSTDMLFLSMGISF